MSDDQAVSLDIDQTKVAKAPPSLRLFVVAGPGSGKTETVRARIQYLTEHEGLTSESLLTLSFSRAAVEAMQRRARTSGTSPGFVTTLDSLAARLLADAGYDVSTLSLDRRISTLIDAIRRDEATATVFESIEHVIVDEVQDVVGTRADLLLAILRALPSGAGFTLLGDPLQGIYDFQLKGSTSTVSQQEAELLGAITLQLRGQYRAETPDARRAMGIRNSDVVLAWTRDMEVHIGQMAHLKTDELTDWLGHTPGTVAILTQSNAQALTIAGELYAQGVAAELLGQANQRPIAPWVANTLGGTEQLLDRTAFVNRASDVAETEAASRWLDLRRLARSNGRSLDVRAVASCLATGVVPISLLRGRDRVTISTVHRAKGLEFDRVLLLSPEDWQRDDPEGLARALYVAITRPRFRLNTFNASKGIRLWHMDRAIDRAVKTPYKRYGLLGVEIRGADWRAYQPPDAEGDPERAQQLLMNLPEPETPKPVQIRLNAYASTSTCPVYDAFLGDVPIGSTGPALSEDLFKRAGQNDRWPSMEGLYLVGTQTVAGPPQPGTVGRNGLWLSPIIVGPAKLNWRQ